jgi:hypothetical protein
MCLKVDAFLLMFTITVITLLLRHEPDKRPTALEFLNFLFKQPPRPSRAYLYDIEADPSEYASLNNIVKDRLAAIFHLYGAVDMEPPLLMPVLDPEEEKSQATFIDRHGGVVTLPNNLGQTCYSREHQEDIANVFRPK